MHRHGRWSLLSGPGGGSQVTQVTEPLYYILRMADAATPAGSASSRPASVNNNNYETIPDIILTYPRCSDPIVIESV